MALYENGTTFYGSEDLVNWKFLSNLEFGYECLDIFELQLDGNKQNMKWVLMDANGSYLIGNFDGIAFTPKKGQKPHIMTLGHDFYAAQSFPGEAFPTMMNGLFSLHGWIIGMKGLVKQSGKEMPHSRFRLG